MALATSLLSWVCQMCYKYYWRRDVEQRQLASLIISRSAVRFRPSLLCPILKLKIPAGKSGWAALSV